MNRRTTQGLFLLSASVAAVVSSESPTVDVHSTAVPPYGQIIKPHACSIEVSRQAVRGSGRCREPRFALEMREERVVDCPCLDDFVPSENGP